MSGGTEECTEVWRPKEERAAFLKSVEKHTLKLNCGVFSPWLFSLLIKIVTPGFHLAVSMSKEGRSTVTIMMKAELFFSVERQTLLLYQGS